MKRLIALMMVLATPALAEEEAFFSLRSTEFVVTIAFIVFIGVLIYAGVPAKIAALLDARATQIKADLDEARALRDEARAILSSYDKKQKDVQEQSDRIINAAKEEAMAAAAKAKDDLKASIARRLAAAVDQIASAEAKAISAVRQQAVQVAVAAAGDVLKGQMTADAASGSIDAVVTFGFAYEDKQKAARRMLRAAFLQVSAWGG
jgi:F-type H+-transporting ATPase subunit b